MNLTPDTLVEGLLLPKDRANVWLPHLKTAMDEFVIDSVNESAAFIAQVAVETMGFRRMRECMDYSTPERIWDIFKSKTDLDKDKVPDPEETEMCRGFVHNPEKLANFVYAGRGGNDPDPAKGHGFMYRGGGGMHLTFLDGYRACGVALRIDLVGHPELIERPDIAMRSAAWYWSVNKCDEPAERWDIRGVTKRINPGMAGQADRLTFSEKMRAALGGSPG